MNYDVAMNKLMEHEVHQFSAEAAELGWNAWPTQFKVPGLGNGRLFIFKNRKMTGDGETVAVHYIQQFGCIEITVYND